MGARNGQVGAEAAPQILNEAMKTFPNKGQKCPRCGDPMPVTRIPLVMVTGGKEQWPKLCGCERRENDERAMRECKERMAKLESAVFIK